jgi:hypothetical protein
MIHTCRITRRTTTSQDEYGSPVYNDVDTTSKCRFAVQTGNISNFSSGEHSIDKTILFLPADVDIQTGDTVTGDPQGFDFTYTVEDVKPMYNFWTDTVHHYECVLEVVN